MEESGKGTAAGPSTKNSSASLDDDFGKDFLNSWKPSKFGNDSMDFDVQPMNGKNKKFSFGKLDDFDLGADFDKLPSFKMDMSDLDFSSPVKKTGTKPSSNEKSNNESLLGKKGQEKDKFSFSFDFDELGKFDLEPQVSNGGKIEKKKNTDAQPTTSMTSLDLNKNKTQNQNQNQNSTTDTNKNTLKPETSSKSNNSTENINNTQITKQPSESISNGSNSSRKTNPIITREESKEFSLHSISGTSSSRRFRESIDKPEKRDTTSAQSMGSSSQSRNNSPVVSISSATRDKSKEKDRPNNNLGPNRNSDCDKILNPVTRLGNSNPGKEKLSILYKSQQNSILSMKQSSDLNSKKIEGMNLQSSEMRRDSKQPDIQRQSEISKTGLLTTLEKPSTKGISFGTGNSKIDPENRTFSTLRTSSNLITNNSLSKDEKQTLVSRLVKMNQRSPTTTVEKDFNSAKSSETNKVSLSPQNKTPTAPTPKQNPSFLSPSLKRKASEESVEDPFTRSNPLKRISSNLPVQTRKSPEIERTEIQEDLNKCLLSPNLLTLIERKIPDFEMPVLLENNSNVEKAEAISKDLDDICSMLKKKHEEAKELLVRAVVNNNKLLMLNHPIYDGKNIHALESFAANLRAKHLVS